MTNSSPSRDLARMTEDQNVDLITKVYSKMTVGFGGTDNVIAPGSSYIVMANPGILLDPKWDLKTEKQRELWSLLLNRAPLPAPLFQSMLSVEDVYGAILAGKEVPNIELSPAEKAKLAAAKKTVLDTRSDYREYQNLFDIAALAYESALATYRNDPEKPVPREVYRAWQNAREDWFSLGNKQEYETAYATMVNLQGRDPNVWWKELDDAWEANREADRFETTDTFPDYATIFDASRSWTKFEFTFEDFTKQENSKSTKAGGGVSAGFGMWRASANATYGSDSSYSRTQTTEINLSAELLRLTIVRPWLDPSVFRSRAWRYTAGQGDLVSNGANAAEGETPTGAMPLFPTDIILAKNFTVSGKFSDDEQSEIRTMLETEASVGYGPFSISGRYAQSDTEKETKGRVEGTSISNPEVQMIGWFCHTVAVCPNPDPDLPWNTPLTIDHLPQYRAAAASPLEPETLSPHPAVGGSSRR